MPCSQIVCTVLVIVCYRANQQNYLSLERRFILSFCSAVSDNCEPDDDFGSASAISLEMGSDGHTFHTVTGEGWLYLRITNQSGLANCHTSYVVQMGSFAPTPIPELDVPPSTRNTPPLDSAIITPTHESVLTSLAQTDVNRPQRHSHRWQAAWPK